ncbi:MAG: prolipoprotein diacylglyceryl transferase [Deltaproteobacteria bacterium]|nr:MAG: prolipoprotein diacylglyceryl transferase [Deltaproteobacteria bacterium]
MRPILFEIPIPFLETSIPISAYGTMLSLSLIIGIYLASRNARKQGLDELKVLTACIWGVVFLIIGARVFFIIQHYPRYLADPMRILRVWKGGLVFYGGLIGGVAASVIYMRINRISVGKFVDAFTPTIPLGLFLTRIGCFLNGCCYGKVSELSWAVQYPQGSRVFNAQLDQGLIEATRELSLPVHPTQLYSSLNGLMLFLIVTYWARRKSFDSELFWGFCLFYSIARFILEFFRGDQSQTYLFSLTVPQLVSIPLGILAIGFLAYGYRKVSKSDRVNVT